MAYGLAVFQHKIRRQKTKGSREKPGNKPSSSRIIRELRGVPVRDFAKFFYFYRFEQDFTAALFLEFFPFLFCWPARHGDNGDARGGFVRT